MATLSTILTWKPPWTEGSLAGYNPRGCKVSNTTEQLNNDKEKIVKNRKTNQTKNMSAQSLYFKNGCICLYHTGQSWLI